jgi:hypothetical protein
MSTPPRLEKKRPIIRSVLIAFSSSVIFGDLAGYIIGFKLAGVYIPA